jgi:hypothetical protein
MKNLNEQIVNSAPPAAADDPIREVVSGLYSNGPAQAPSFIVPKWQNGVAPNVPNQANFYQGVVANACRTCHIAQPFPQLQFNSSDKFINLAAFNAGTIGGTANRLMLGTAQSRVCGDYIMPHALRTHEIFWNPASWDVSEWGPPPAPFNGQFQAFGDGVGGSTWKAALCTSYISNLLSNPSNFYQHTIQPIFNGKCVGCHIAGGPAPFPLTEGVSYNALLPGRVVPGNDDPAAAGNTLLRRTTAVAPGSGRMPPNCFRAPELPNPALPNGTLPCLSQVDIDKLKAWIRSGAH